MVINEERMVILNGKKFGTQNLIANFWKSTELLRIKNGEKKKAKKMIEYEAKNGKKVMTLEKFRHEMSKMRENGARLKETRGILFGMKSGQSKMKENTIISGGLKDPRNGA